jgi:hypothetical protein
MALVASVIDLLLGERIVFLLFLSPRHRQRRLRALLVEGERVVVDDGCRCSGSSWQRVGPKAIRI